MVQSGNKNKLKIVFMLLAVMAFTYPAHLFALTKEEVEIQKRNKQSELDRLNQQIKEYQGQIQQTRSQAASLNNEIKLYNIEIAATETQLTLTGANIENTELQIKGVTLQIEEKRLQIEKQKSILAELIVALDQYDNASALQLGLGSDNFSSFLDQVKYTESVQSQVASLLQQIKVVKAKLEQDQAELEANLSKLKELETQLVETQDALAKQKQSKEKFLSDVKGKESNYQKLLTSAQKQEAQINKEIDDLEASLRQGGSPSKLKPVRGILAWPMDGVITQNYGNTGFTKLGYNFHNGLDIAAPAGTNIYAAADGVVNATGTGQAAYGNWVTIKHTLPSGKEIITLYAHMISFKVKVGQRVSRGDLVGYEGNTGNTSRLLYGPERGYHLHFTVFDAEGFGISQGQHTATYGAYRVPYGYTYNPKDFL